MNTHFYKSKIFWLIVIFICSVSTALYFYFFKQKLENKESHIQRIAPENVPVLLTIKNLETFFYQGNSRDIDFYAKHKPSDKKIKSIKIHQFSTAKQQMYLDKTLYFDKNSNLVMCEELSYDGYDTSYVYYFHNDTGNTFLEVYIGSNKYDTTYTLRNFDKYNHIREEIRYNVKRNELNGFVTRNIKLHTDEVLRVEETTYQYDWTIKDVLPYYKRDMFLTLANPTTVKVSTNWIVCQDSSNNSKNEKDYGLNNALLTTSQNQPEYKYNAEGNWVEMKNGGELIKREFDYYNEDEPDIKNKFLYSKSVLLKLDSMMLALPDVAWKNHNKRHADISIKSKLYAEGKYGEQIELNEAKSIENFTPALWYLVGLDSGKISGFEGMCYVAGYNTPVKDENEFNTRCLAIYERVNDHFILRKQSATAIESFVDQENDFSYHDFNEANFYVSIEDGEVIVSYSYMRGEASYSYAYQDDDWVLIRYHATHRTCCQDEMYSYDYKTKMYSASIYQRGEEEGGENDTTINVLQNRPIVFMDSINVMQYDYDETGLLVK